MPIATIAAAGLRKSILLGTAVLALTVPSVGQDRMVLGPRQFEQDRSGAGAVLCSWAIYLSVQAQTAACDLARRPVDDAIDEKIAAIDEFILTNSSLRPTRAALDDFKRRAVARDIDFARLGGREKVCQSQDLERFRSVSPDQMRTSTRTLLAVPREPVMNPCL